MAETVKVKGSAAGQYLGYGLQAVRVFYHLLKCDENAHVALEHLDDVSVHNLDGTVLAEQCKSALKSNPISNWAEDLWKTFHLWIDNVESGVFDIKKTQFQLYVTPCKAGAFALRMHELTDKVEIEKFLKDLEKRRKKVSSDTDSAKHLDALFSTDVDLVIQVIQRFKLINEDDDPIASIEAHLNPTVSEQIMQQACSYGIGEAKIQVEEAIRKQKSLLIPAKEFRVKFRAFLTKYDATNVLHSLAEKPADEIISATLSSAPPFVKQLNFIDADVALKTRAASDFLRSSADRTHWADKGLIFDGSVDEYNDSLTQRFGHVKGEVDITHKSMTSVDRGRLTYGRCCQIPSIPLQGRVVPSHFLAGSLNELADRQLIGWHPDYVDLFEKEAEK